MKTLRPTLGILTILLLLSACGQENSQQNIAVSDNGNLQKLVKAQQEVEKTVELELQTSSREQTAGKTFEVRVDLKNPAGKTIDGVRSWVAYDTSKLKAVRLDDTASDFDFFLPQENSIQVEQGMIALGRSSKTPMNKAIAHVVTITFEVLPTTTEKVTSIDFFDYQTGTDGHTNVLLLVDGQTHNILKDPAQPGVRLTLLPEKNKR